MMAGSAFKNKGVQPLLDAVNYYLPSPMDVEAVQGVSTTDLETKISRPADDGAPFAALAFKVMADPFIGSLTFCRIYRFKLKTLKSYFVSCMLLG